MKYKIVNFVASWLVGVAVAALPACAQPTTAPAPSAPTVATVQSVPVHSRFVHPGILLTRADLDAVKANLNTEPWKTGYAALAADSHSQLTYQMQGPFETVTRAPHLNRNPWMNDMQAIFNLSRMWYFTGNTAYAQKAHDILLAWATTQKTFGGTEQHLDLGDYAYRYAGGADILRGTWPGWTQADTDAVKSLFENVYWPASYANLNTLGPANKGMLTLAAGAAIAVFNDDQAKFDHILHLFRTGASSALPNTLSSGELGETGRDQGHAYGQWVSMAFIAEIFWKQGVDVYAERDNRLLSIGEYYARFNLGQPTPFVPFGTTDYLYLQNNSVTWPHGRMGMNLLHGAYLVRKGLSAPYLELRRQEVPVDMDNFVFEKTADTSTATPPSAFPFPAATSITTGLTNLDIGTATPAGSGTYNNGVWTVQGAGSEIWTHGDDSFHFLYKQVMGDCTIIAKVNSVGNTAPNARAGVMLRDSLAPNAANRAWVAITPGQTFEFHMHGWTEVYGGANWEKKSRPIPQLPYWVKIERLGNIINLYTSPDGTSWGTTGVGQFADMGSTVYIGLAVSSQKNGTLNTATFTNVRITGGDGGEPPQVSAAPFAVYASPGNRQVPLRWLESFGATSYNVKRATVRGGPYTKVATVSGTSYVDKGVTNGTTYYYVVTAVNAAGESGNSLEDLVTPRVPSVNAPMNGAASAFAQRLPGGGAGGAFDRAGGKWYSGDNSGTAGWLQYDFGVGAGWPVRSYGLTSGNDVPGRDPKNWQFQGSNDGTNWTTLDTQIGQQFTTRGQTRWYAINNTTAYRYYRLNITAIADPAVNSMQLAELMFRGDAA